MSGIARNALIITTITLLIWACARGPANPASPAADLAQSVDEWALPLTDSESLDPLMEAIGDRRYVLLGESTHGTHEYYRWRADISRRLITEEGFRFIAVEGDWKAIYRINQYVRHQTPEEVTARDVLSQITRWPTWLWANEEFEEFVEWLRDYNEGRSIEEMVGLYGLDMQDPADSLQAVVQWFETHRPDDAQEVAGHYECFAPFAADPGEYLGHLAGGGESCAQRLGEPVGILQAAFNETSEPADARNIWAAKQNARIVRLSEERYRSMARRDANSWNIRAHHMHETFVRLAELYGDGSRGIAWAHNTHVGDSRHTSMRMRGEANIGELLRDSAGENEVFILGFGSHRGTVIFGPQWGAPMQRGNMIEAHPESLDGILHGLGRDQFLLIMDDEFRSAAPAAAIAQRAVGVVYAPPNEAYVPTIFPLRYDGFIYIDETRALSPID